MSKLFKKPVPQDDLTPEYLGKLKWLNPRQATAYLQISRSTLAALQREGRIPFSRVSNRLIRFDRAQLDQWIADNAVTA